jgi:hypothetical protein
METSPMPRRSTWPIALFGLLIVAAYLAIAAGGLPPP